MDGRGFFSSSHFLFLHIRWLVLRFLQQLHSSQLVFRRQGSQTPQRLLFFFSITGCKEARHPPVGDSKDEDSDVPTVLGSHFLGSWGQFVIFPSLPSCNKGSDCLEMDLSDGTVLGSFPSPAPKGSLALGDCEKPSLDTSLLTGLVVFLSGLKGAEAGSELNVSAAIRSRVRSRSSKVKLLKEMLEICSQTDCSFGWS